MNRTKFLDAIREELIKRMDEQKGGAVLFLYHYL